MTCALLIFHYCQNLLEMNGWHPISVLNNDYKTYAKILALRSSKVVPYLIHLDQTGFVQGRLIIQ